MTCLFNRFAEIVLALQLIASQFDAYADQFPFDRDRFVAPQKHPDIAALF